MIAKIEVIWSLNPGGHLDSVFFVFEPIVGQTIQYKHAGDRYSALKTFRMEQLLYSSRNLLTSYAIGTAF
eukprot:COSAG05_NODE_222_length_13641_cov_73.452001_8_plen_70_part_00